MCVVIRRPCGSRPASQSRFVSANRVGKDVARCHVAALGDQLVNELSPHSRAATGDDCNPAGEILHDVVPPLDFYRSIRKRALEGPVRHQSRLPSLMALRRSLLLSLPVRIDAPIGAEQPIPEIVDYREIAISIPLVEKMELLLSPEPCKSSQP